MTRNVDIMVFSNPVEGREDEYNRWYNEVHLPEVVASSPVFLGAARYRLSGPAPSPHAYVAIYKARTDDPLAVMAELGAKAGRGEFVMTDAIDTASVEIRFAEPLVAIG